MRGGRGEDDENFPVGQEDGMKDGEGMISGEGGDVAAALEREGVVIFTDGVVDVVGYVGGDERRREQSKAVAVAGVPERKEGKEGEEDDDGEEDEEEDGTTDFSGHS